MSWSTPSYVEDMSAEAVLGHVVERFHPRLAVACSFQKEASVIAHMVLRRAPDARLFVLDTGQLFAETHVTWRRFEERFGVSIRAYRGDWSRPGLWKVDPDACCAARKVDPLADALTDADCWVSGARRAQTTARARIPKLGWDGRRGLWKANPLAAWSEADVWRYIATHELPYHPLHDRGYASIGCVPCTSPGADRAGRWAGHAKVECGIHV